MKKKNQRISDLFYNNRFLFVFSVVVAVAIWLVVAVELGDEIENTIKNVPVRIDYGNVQNNLGGLKPYGETEYFVDVTISGQKYIVESDDIKDDIVVTANTGYVNSVGTYSLSLEFGTEDARPAYDFVKFSTDTIEVYFDYPKEREFKIEADVSFDGASVPDGYYMADLVLPDAKTVKVSGPETEVNRIERVVAEASVDGNLRQSETVDAVLRAVTKDGSIPKYISFNRQSAKVQLTIPVYKIVTLPITCGFSNIPSEYLDNLPFSVVISPAAATFGVPESKAEAMTSMEFATKIDFSKLNTGTNVFTIDATSSEIVGGIVLDETKEFVVSVNVVNMASKTIPAPRNVSFINVPDGLETKLSKLNFSDITVIGPKDNLDLLNSESIILTADFSNVDADASDVVTVPVRLSSDNCWSYGDYTATVTIS